jgi:copper resistance protein C
VTFASVLAASDKQIAEAATCTPELCFVLRSLISTKNRLMKWLRDIGVMLLLTGASVEQAHAHAFLNRAEPPVGSRVIVMPHEVRIWFTERIELADSSIKVFDATGKQIDRRDVYADPKNKALLRVSLPVLAPGTYKVIWQVVSVDTHATNGDFTFQFLPKATLPHARQ